MTRYEVYVQHESLKEFLMASFPSYADAESYIAGRLVAHVIECCRVYWEIERCEDEWAISIGSNLTKFRISVVTE